jgi:putative oxidoreductase
MFRSIVRTSPRTAPLAARLILAAIMFPHGAQHLLGWFGGYGFAGTQSWMTDALGIPAPLAALAILTEFLAPLLLAVGLGGRVAATGIAALMAVAATTHAGNGFFMNWFGTMGAGQEGFEYHLLAIGLALPVIIEGSGRLSLDLALVGDGREEGARRVEALAA